MTHPSAWPDGPERDAWLEAEVEYANRYDPRTFRYKSFATPDKEDHGATLWRRVMRFIARMMK